METAPREERKARVLVIDDEEDVRLLLSDILSEDHEVEIASDGSQGVNKFKQNSFDMVLTDLGMPGMSGWDVAGSIKSINNQVPIALVTGWQIELEEEELKGKGVDFIVNKPFEVKNILKLVQDGILLRESSKAV